LKESAQYRSIIAFVYPRYSYGKLHVFELIQADLNGVMEVVSKKEKRSSIFYTQSASASSSTFSKDLTETPPTKQSIGIFQSR
jgi:hypothetical protein